MAIINSQPNDKPTKVSELINDSGFLNKESDPNVSDWAKNSNKPTYTYSEVGAAASSHKHAAGDITSGILSPARGGTGVGSLAQLATALGISSGITMKLLWENASPTSDFAVQTISLDLSAYDMVMLVSAETALSSFAKKGETCRIVTVETKYHVPYHRTATVSADGITFTSAASNQSANTISNCKPLYIYGIKGVS